MPCLVCDNYVHHSATLSGIPHKYFAIEVILIMFLHPSCIKMYTRVASIPPHMQIPALSHPPLSLHTSLSHPPHLAVTLPSSSTPHCHPPPSLHTSLTRSATLVLAYLMRHEGKSLQEAHSFLKERRPFIRPNFGFWRQLIDYEHCLFQRNTVNMIKWKEDTFIPDIYYDQYKDLY